MENLLFKIGLLLFALSFLLLPKQFAVASEGYWDSGDFVYEDYEKTVYGCDYSRTIKMKGKVIAGFSESGLSKVKNEKNLVLPRETTEGETIIGVGESAFKGMELEAVTFPTGMLASYEDTLTKTVTKRGNFIIAESAFAKNNLTEVYIPNGVLAILPSAFANNQITRVTLPTTIWWVETAAFSKNQIEDLIFPRTTHFALEIHGMAFAYNQIKAVRLPDSTAVVNKDVFDANPGMEEMSTEAPAGQQAIGGGVVYMYTDNEKLKDLDRIHSVDKTIDSQKSWHQKVVVNDANGNPEEGMPEFPDNHSWEQEDFTYSLNEETKEATITGLSEWGAITRKENKNVMIPEKIIENGISYKVTAIGDAEPAKSGLFATESGQIETVELPYELKSIGDFAFQNCGLKEVYFPPYLESIGMAAFQTNDLTSIILPDTITTLGSGCFATNPLLEHINLSKGLTKIAESAFACSDAKHYMTNLTKIDFHEGIESFGRRAFAGNNFRRIEIPSTTKAIGEYAFSTKNYLNEDTTLVLPEGLITIGDNAFRNKVISEVNLPESVEALCGNTFRKEYSDGSEGIVTKVYVSSQQQYEDKEHFPDSQFQKLYLTASSVWTSSDFTYEDRKLSEEESVRYGEEMLRLISGFTEAGAQKLQDNPQLVLPAQDENGKTVQGVAEAAFKDKGLEKLTIPDVDLFFIDKESFAENHLTEMSLSAGVVWIGEGGFSGNELSSLHFSALGNEEVRIGARAFAKNELTKVQLPENTVELNRSTFAENMFHQDTQSYSVVELFKIGDITAETLEYIGHPEAENNIYQTLTEGSLNLVDQPWNLDDFTLEGSAITGLSQQGKEKIQVNAKLVLPNKNSEGEYITEIKGSTTGEGTFTVKIEREDGEDEKIYAPSAVVLPEKLKVIGDKAFARVALNAYETEKITKISFPATLETIGNMAFQHEGLKQVILPDSVTSIGIACFGSSNGNETIEKVVLSKKLDTISAGAFGFQNITSVEIPNGITSIGARAFQGSPLQSLELPDSVTSIGDYAFENHQIQKLILPKNIVSIGKYAFKVYAEGREKCLAELMLPQKLETIGKEAFYGSNLTEIDLPEKVTVLPADAFSESNQIVVLKTAIKDLEETAALILTGKCHEVVFDKLANTGWRETDFNYEGSAITGFSQSGKEKFETQKDLVLPDQTLNGTDITVIKEEAFGISADDVEQQKYDVLSPKGMHSVVLPEKVERIEKKAFEYNNLKEISLPDTVCFIGESAFHGNKLEKLELPDSVTELGDGAFAMNGLTEVKLSKNLTEISQAVFSMNIWMTEISLPEGITEIGAEAFAGARLETLEIPKSVTKIGKKAFHLHRLSSLTIPGNVKEIGESAFEGTYKYASLKELTLEEGIEVIGKYAFKEGLLSKVNLPDSLLQLGEEPFLNNEGVDASGIVYLYTENEKHLAFAKGSSYHIFGPESSQEADSPESADEKTITLAKGRLILVKSGKKKLSVKWKKVEKATGYQVSYKQAGKKTKMITVKKTSKIIRKLKSKKKYTIKVRAYHKDTKTGTVVYGKWSKAKKVKVK